MDFGPVTDTRTLEGAVIQAITKLRAAPADDRSRELIRRALKYRDVLASWEMIPPKPDEQAETVARVLQVISAIMRHLSQDDEAEACPDPAGHEPDAPDSGWPAQDSDVGGVRSGSSRKRQKSVGRIELMPSPSLSGGKIDILFPFRRRWAPVPGMRGVTTQSIYGNDASGLHHVMVRLDADAQLDEHRQVDVEVVYILRGGISLGDDSLFAGAVVRLRGGVMCPPIRALGDSELLLMGTCRAKLCG